MELSHLNWVLEDVEINIQGRKITPCQRVLQVFLQRDIPQI